MTFSSNNKVFPGNTHPQYEQLRRSELLRENGAYFRLGKFIAQRFRRGAAIQIDAASNGNQRYDVVLGIAKQKINEIMARLGSNPEGLESRLLPRLLKKIPKQFPICASDNDAQQILIGQKGPVIDGQLLARARSLGLDKWYGPLLVKPLNRFIVDPQGRIKEMDSSPRLLAQAIGRLSIGDAFSKIKTACPMDVLVTSNWLGHLATTIDYQQRTPAERECDIQKIKDYLATAADKLKRKGLIVIGCVDHSWEVPKLFPKGRFQPVQDPELLIPYSPLSTLLTTEAGRALFLREAMAGRNACQQTAPFVYEKVS